MKEFLTSLLVFLFSSLAYADEVAKTTADKVLERADKVGGFIETSLTQLTQKLGTTMDYLWPRLVKQQIAYGVADITIAFAALFIGALIIILLTAVSKTTKEDDDKVTCYMLATATSVVCILVCAYFLYYGIIHLIAPETQAFQDLLDTLHSCH